MLTKLTPTLRALINQYEATLPAQDVTDFIDHINVLSLKYQRQLEAAPEGAPRARRLHELMEEAMASVGDAKPSCRAGCSACCHLEVEITAEEGVLLSDRVKAGHVINRELLAKQAARERKGEEWDVYNSPANRCVFLGPHGACTVYEDRPSACRKLLVISHPVECSTLSGKVEAITIPMAEVLISTAISLPGTVFMSIAKAVTLGLRDRLA